MAKLWEIHIIEKFVPSNRERLLLQTIYICLLFYRLPDRDEEQPEHYDKDKGSAQIHGQIFEYKFCALLYLGPETRGISLNLLLT